MKKVIALCIALVMVVSLFTVSFTSADDCVYLSDLAYVDYGNMASANWPGINKIKTTGKPLTIAGQSFEKGIAIHPTATTDAYIRWDISSYSYNAFKAVIGKDDVNDNGTNAYKTSKSTYLVILDGVTVFQKTLVANTMQEIGIQIPSGTKEIKLQVNNGGDGHSYDGSDFAMARLCNDLLPDNGTYKPDFTKDYVYLSDMNYSNYNAFVGTKGAYIARDKNIRGTRLYTPNAEYAKGLCIHAEAAGKPKAFVEFDIKGLGYTVFAAYLGLAEQAGEDLSAASVTFIVYVDGTEVYKSAEMKKTDKEDKLISIDITNASTLKLEIDPGAGNSSDWGTFGNALIGKYKNAQHAYAAIAGGSATCVDADPKDHKCDICGETMSSCVDEDPADHKCDICGKTLTECVDEDPADHKCDICGDTLTECADKDNDHKCDVCGKTLTECADKDNDHKCDICGDTLTECADKDNDHKCDICGDTLTECADKDNDHKCDICGDTLTECADKDNDHKCDICGDTLTECADKDNDHKCDICGDTLTECADKDNDHKCDICGDTLTECADKDNDHKCDICGDTLTECADKDNDHKCDICGDTLTECADKNNDHKCDICGKTLTQCADKDNDHKCDICGKTLTQCVDEDKNAKCDICGKEMPEDVGQIIGNPNFVSSAIQRVSSVVSEVFENVKNIIGVEILDNVVAVLENVTKAIDVIANSILGWFF